MTSTPSADQGDVHYRRLFEALSDAVFLIDNETGDLLDANPAASDLYGYTCDQLLRMKNTDLSAQPEETEHVTRNTPIEPAEVVTIPRRLHKNSNGDVFPVEITGRFFIKEGRPLHIAIIRDVTEFRRVEDELRRSEELLNAAQRLTKVGGWEWDVDSQHLHWTRETYRIHGFDQDLFPAGSGQGIARSLECYDPDDRRTVGEAFSRSLREGVPYDLECRFTSADGRRLWVRTAGEPIYDQDRIVKIHGNFMDITERKRAEAVTAARLRLREYALDHSVDELLRTSLDEAEALTDSSIGFFHLVDDDQVTLHLQTWSTNTLETQCTAEGKGTHYDVSAAGVWADCIRERHPVVYNDYAGLSHRKGLPPGHAPVTRIASIPLMHGDRIEGVLGVGNKPTSYDHTDMDVLRSFADLAWNLVQRRRAEEALSSSEQRLRAITSSVSDIIVEFDRQGRIQFINRVEAGSDIAAADGTGVLSWTDPEDHARLAQSLEHVFRTGETTVHEATARRIDGETHRYSVSASPVMVEGQVDRVVTVSRDVTEQRQAEEEYRRLKEQILEVQKLESLGVLAGGIAHDFNNLLMVMLGHADLALSESPASSPTRDSLLEIKSAAQRAADLCRQMLAYSGKGRFIIESIDLRELVNQMSRMLRSSVSESMSLSFDLPENLPPTEGDATQIRQVLMNLVINASEAIGDQNGAIDVSLGALDLLARDPRALAFGQELPPGRYLSLEVSDTGSGMDEATKSRIFEPFFTTKFIGRGLGLSAVLGIVRGHHGALDIDTAPGAGTTFRILLPASSAAMPAEAPPRTDAAPGATGAQRVVLLVEDEESIRSLGSTMLQRLGFSVITACDGLEAIEIYSQHAAEIACVLLDMGMPRMDGEAALQELQHLDSSVRVVLTSGHSEHDLATRFADARLAGIIQKPYTMSALQEILRRALAAPPVW